MNRHEKDLKKIFSMIEGIPQPVSIHDQGLCVFVNNAFSTLFGYSRPLDLFHVSMGELISPWPSESPRVGFRKVLGRKRNGQTVELELATMPVMDGGSMLYQSILRDVSELRSWEDRLLQSERLTAMGKLAGEIAHEINNPLGGILLYANLIREDISREGAVYENLEKIIKLATRCRIIARGLLTFGRSSSRSYSSVDINHMIREMFSMVEDHRMFRNVKVEMDLNEHLPRVMADKGQMEQVVLNLIINAGEAVEGKGSIYIKTATSEHPKGIEFIVRDTGHGISKEIVSRIFEPFFTTKRPGKGTGLGLSITHGIVQRHGGKIQVESEPSLGTTFKVFLPLTASHWES